jgi:predicted SAM-dependent methyltransferase
MTKRYLNLGCGERFHREWTNVDFVTKDQSVMQHDLRLGIPFADMEFDVVYHSHVLEHFPKSKALPFLQECHRVLKKPGIVRIAVPDLERIVLTYMQALEGAMKNDPEWRINYEWIILEIFDQMVREQPGGEMAAYLERNPIPNELFVLSRMGGEGRRFLERRRQSDPGRAAAPAAHRRPRLVRLVRSVLPLLQNATVRREWAIKRLLGAEYELLQLGRYRRSGEIHLWMYDRYSLADLLCAAGFQNTRAVSPTQSSIPGWAGFNLDTGPDGTVYKPDSFYMEAEKV